jgi:transposase InsO family protein
MGERHDAGLVTDALQAAVATRGRSRMDSTIFHTDRGSEYTSAACIDVCERLGLRRSMGRTGSCLDNAVAESWFATLKVELVDRCHYPHPRSSAGLDLPLDRLVQPPSAAFHQRLPAARRLGTPAPTGPPATIDPGRIATVSGQRGKSTRQRYWELRAQIEREQEQLQRAHPMNRELEPLKRATKQVWTVQRWQATPLDDRRAIIKLVTERIEVAVPVRRGAMKGQVGERFDPERVKVKLAG